MDDVRFGLAIRALRRRLGWRQRDLALRARVRQQEVSNVERGRVEQVRVGTVRRVAGALDARVSLDLRWRGGALDRLIDRRHAQLVERAAAVLVSCGWEVRPEVSFTVAGRQGSIDLLAWHRLSRTVLVIEVKTELTSVEETLRRFDLKQRAAKQVAVELLGWSPSVVGAALVLPDTSTARRRVAEHRTTFAARFPDEGRALRSWLRNPDRPFAVVWFLSAVPTVGTKLDEVAPHRVRVPNRPPKSAAGG